MQRFNEHLDHQAPTDTHSDHQLPLTSAQGLNAQGIYWDQRTKLEAAGWTPNTEHPAKVPGDDVLPESDAIRGLASPGLESVQDTETEKEAVVHPPPDYQSQRFTPERRRTICGLSRLWFPILLLLLLCLAIGLGVGLGVGLSKKSSSHRASVGGQNATSSGGGGINLDYYSKIGAFNGSGIALASESFDTGGRGEINIYFQHHTGQVRSAVLSSDGSWQGGDYAEVIAIDAKNATPISAVAYAQNGTSAWHLFYIDANNIIKERVYNNDTNLWSDGPIGDLQLKAMDTENVGLQACWYGSYYGDAVYLHSPVPGQNTNVSGSTSDSAVGMHLWYGDSSTSFQEVEWIYGDANWTIQEKFTGFNGHAGVGCYSWGPTSVSYFFALNLNDAVEVWWKDLNTTLSATSSHPVNTWTNSSVTVPNVYQNTSLGYTNFLYVQNSDLSISGYNVSFDAENTSILTAETFKINGPPGTPGTHLSVTTLPDASGGNDLLAFYQTNGSDITEFVRDLVQGQWTSSSLPIPPN